jgi:hypothetical protein
VHLLEHLVDVGAVFECGEKERGGRLGLAIQTSCPGSDEGKAVWSIVVRWADTSEESASLPL